MTHQAADRDCIVSILNNISRQMLPVALVAITQNQHGKPVSKEDSLSKNNRFKRDQIAEVEGKKAQAISLELF